MADRTVSVVLRAQIADYTSKLGQAARTTGQFGREISGLAKNNSAAMRDIERGAGLAGVALLGLAGWAVKVGMEFDKQMSAVGAVTNASAQEMDGLREAAIEAGKATVFSATEAAKAETELGKAGLSTADIMGGALSGSLALAAAGGLDLAEAADISAKAMNIWGLEGKDVTHIADVLAAAANKSATDVHEMGEALRMGGMVAKQAGMSIEETVGTLSAFADRALVGSDAGTSLKTMLMFLAKPTSKAADLMEELGIQTYDAAGSFVGIEKLAGQLQERMAGLTQQQRQNAMAIIFGSDATRAATVLYELGAKGIKEYVDAVDDAGAAQRTASAMTDNLAGDLERLKGSLESLMIESQSGATGGLRTIVKTLDMLVEKFAALPGPMQSMMVILGGVGGAALLAAAGFLKMRRMTSELIGSMRQGGPAANRFADGLQTTSKWAARASVALTALMVVEEVVSAIRDAEVDVNALSESLDRLAKTGEASTEVTRLFGEDLKGFGEAVRATQGWGADMMKGTEAIPVIGDIFAEGERMASDFNRSAGDSVIVLKALDDQLATMVRNGQVTEAITIAQKLAQANNLMWDEVEAALPGFTAAMMNASSATQNQAGASKDAAGATGELSNALGEATAKARDLVAEWDELHGKTLSADEALLAAKQAVHDLGETFKKTGGKIKGNSEAALENRIAMEKTAQIATEAAQKYFELTGDAEGASKMLDVQRKAAEEAAIANGGNAKEVHKLAGELFGLPNKVTPKVSVEGAKAGEAAVKSLHAAIANLHSRTVYINTVTTNTTTNVMKTVKIASANRWGGVIEHADAGLVNANVYNAGSKPLYAFAEPETGGEAFVPKYGNYGRSMSILSQAANWYGADVMPRGGGGGILTINLSGASTPFERAMEQAMRRMTWSLGGGNAQTAYGRS